MKQEPTVVKVVGKDDLEKCTRSGWTLIRVLDCQVVEMVTKNEQRLHPPPAPQNGYYPPSQSDYLCLTVPTVISTQRFLIGLDEASALLESQTQMAELATTIRQLEEKHYANSNALGKITAERDNLTQHLGRAKQDIAGFDQTYDKLLGSNRTLERDIAVIRNAIGSEKMAEILLKKTSG